MNFGHFAYPQVPEQMKYYCNLISKPSKKKHQSYNSILQNIGLPPVPLPLSCLP